MNVTEHFDTPACGYDAVAGYTYDETDSYNCDNYHIGFDQETNLHYTYFRDCYDPATGRYCQSDPIGLEGGINTYLYVGGNPLTRIDPNGLIELQFVRSAGVLYVYDDFGELMFTCKAANNVASYAKGPWPAGTYSFSHYNRHPQSGPTGPYGSYGIFVFNGPGRSGMGVHSGRRGPQSKTEGCVRTTDPCMDVLNMLHQQTPITTITIQ